MPSGPTLIDRAEKDSVADRQQADAYLEHAELQALHTLCVRMIDERTKLGKGFAAMVEGWALMGHEVQPPNQNAMDSIERVATQAVEFAREVVREVVRALMQGTHSPGGKV